MKFVSIQSLVTANIKKGAIENTSVKCVNISINATTFKDVKKDIPKDVKCLTVKNHVD